MKKIIMAIVGMVGASSYAGDICGVVTKMSCVSNAPDKEFCSVEMNSGSKKDSITVNGAVNAVLLTASKINKISVCTHLETTYTHVQDQPNFDEVYFKD